MSLHQLRILVCSDSLSRRGTNESIQWNNDGPVLKKISNEWSDTVQDPARMHARDRVDQLDLQHQPLLCEWGCQAFENDPGRTHFWEEYQFAFNFFENITLSSEYLLGSGCHVRHSRPQWPKKIFHLSRGESQSIQKLDLASKMSWYDCSKFDLNKRAYVFMSVSHHHMVVGHTHEIVCLT